MYHMFQAEILEGVRVGPYCFIRLSFIDFQGVNINEIDRSSD